jgi:putative acetyltransferase
MAQLVAQDVIRSFRHSSREVVRELDLLGGLYGRCGLTPLECQALLEVERTPGLGPGVLGERLKVDKAVVSRALRQLAARRLVSAKADARDGRKRALHLTAGGRRELERIHRAADGRVRASLDALPPADREVVLRGMELYARGLRLSRVRAAAQVRLRPIRPRDNAAVAAIIRGVMTEFGAVGPGYSINDPEVDAMARAYAPARHAFFVVEREGRVLGGAGIAPLEGGDPETCELRKMYVLPEGRGLGVGQMLLDRCLDAAREAGFRRCYLETLQRMEQARRLYERNGFRPLCSAQGRTGHTTCDTWYARELGS